MEVTTSRLGPSHDPFKASKFFSINTEKTANLFVFLITVFIVASIPLALNSAFLGESTHRFLIPGRVGTGRVITARDDSEPTNISHIFFGIGASVRTWGGRRRYTEQWWDRNTTRGYAWLDAKMAEKPAGPVPQRVSAAEWTRFKYSSSQSAVRIARIVLESFRLGVPRVRWFVMGDDDTVFFVENLVSVLSSYDHNEMYYIGGNSESVEQDNMHSYDMAFGGGGFAISYPLAARLADTLDSCLDRYYTFYGSDQRVWACIDDIGAVLTLHRGFHQLDIRGDPYGLLAGHPMVPLVSLHHLDYLDPIFPTQTRIESVKTLMTSYRVDPARALQQSFCHHKKLKLSVSISWGYAVQIYPSDVAHKDLKTPLRTFKTWQSQGDGPFTFNTRPTSPDPCKRPVVYFLNRVEAVKNESVTSYEMFEGKDGRKCIVDGYQNILRVRLVVVYSMKMDDDYWKKAPVRQSCEIMDHGKVKNGTMEIRIRK